MIDQTQRERWKSLIGKAKKFGSQIPWLEFQAAVTELERLEKLTAEDPWPPSFVWEPTAEEAAGLSNVPDRAIASGGVAAAVRPMLDDHVMQHIPADGRRYYLQMEVIRQPDGITVTDRVEACPAESKPTSTPSTSAFQGSVKPRTVKDRARAYNEGIKLFRSQGMTLKEAQAEWRKQHPKVVQ